MRKAIPFLVWAGAIAAALAALVGTAVYFLYVPPQPPPHLSGETINGRVRSGGLVRSYRVYLPGSLKLGAPLLMVLHGSMGSAQIIRTDTGYGFDRIADREGFAVAYPNGVDGYWNACNIVGGDTASIREIDDVGFLTALTDALVARFHLDRHRVFAVGLSRGGQMAYRLALEAPEHFRAVAAAGANVPAPGNFKCYPRAGRPSSVLIMNGTDDPLNPYYGGRVRLFGLFMDRGMSLSSDDTAQFFRSRGGEARLVKIEGGGHALPQPWRRAPRLLGPTLATPNGPEVIWSFFKTQR